MTYEIIYLHFKWDLKYLENQLKNRQNVKMFRKSFLQTILI